MAFCGSLAGYSGCGKAALGRDVWKFVRPKASSASPPRLRPDHSPSRRGVSRDSRPSFLSCDLPHRL